VDWGFVDHGNIFHAGLQESQERNFGVGKIFG
jgi:hypothetical protein